MNGKQGIWIFERFNLNRKDPNASRTGEQVDLIPGDALLLTQGIGHDIPLFQIRIFNRYG